MSGEEGSGERTESLGIRRQVELPEANMDGAGDLAPAGSPSAPRPDEKKAGKGAAAEKTVEAKETAAAGQGDGGDNSPTATETAVAAPGTDGDGDEDGMPPDRPKKPVLAAVAIGGAVVLAIPLLLIGTGSHHDKAKHPVAAAANDVLPGDGQVPGSFTSATPTPTPTPSASPKKDKKKTAKGSVKGSTAAHKKRGWGGATYVLLKNSGSRLCADIPAYEGGSIDTEVAQYYCTYGNADNEMWTLGVLRDMHGPGGAPLFTIRNTKDNLCMDLPGHGKAAQDSKVRENACTPKGDNQLWYRTHVRGDWYLIRNYASKGLCLGPLGRSSEKARQQVVHTCGTGDQWSWANS